MGNPVIHRAILWLSWNGSTSTWSAPALENYPEELWDCNGNHDFNSMSGTLKITLKSNYREIDVSINLNSMNHISGYLTMGDNNGNVDQNSNISYMTLINTDRIKSVAWKEIPWIGAIKMISKGNMEIVDSKVPNTIPNLAAFFITIILTVISIGYIVDEVHLIRIRKQKKS